MNKIQLFLFQYIKNSTYCYSYGEKQGYCDNKDDNQEGLSSKIDEWRSNTIKKLHEINIVHDDVYVYGFWTTHLSNEDEVVPGVYCLNEQIDMQGKITEQIQLDEDEQVTILRGRSGFWTDRIEIVTSEQRTISGGGQGGSQYEYVDFVDFYCGYGLSQLGVIYESDCNNQPGTVDFECNSGSQLFIQVLILFLF